MSLGVNPMQGLLSYKTSPNAKYSFVQTRLMQKVFVGFCILLGTVLRGFHLASQNFWFDEMASIRYATDLEVALRDIHPPLYYLLLHLTLDIGKSEFILRFPSLITGILSIALVYVVGRQMLSSSAALIATFLVSISPVLVWHSQDARMYSLLLFASLLVVYTYLRSLRVNNWTSWASYFVVALVATYTHLYAFLLLGVLGLHFLVFHRKLIKPWLITHIVLALAYLPPLLNLTGLKGIQIGGSHATGLWGFLYSYFVFTNGYSLGPSIDELRIQDLHLLIPYLPLLVPITLIVLLLFFAGLHYLRRDSLERFVLLVSWTFLPALIANVLPYFRPSLTFNVRYVIFSVPAFLFIIGIGISHLKPRYLATGCLLILVLYNAISLYNNAFDQIYAKEDVRGAAQYIAAKAQPNDHILVITVGQIFDWYFHAENTVFSNLPYQPPTDLVGEAANGSSSIWLVKSRPWQTDPSNQIQTILDNDYILLSTSEFPGVSVYHYKLETSSNK